MRLSALTGAGLLALAACAAPLEATSPSPDLPSPTASPAPRVSLGLVSAGEPGYLAQLVDEARQSERQTCAERAASWEADSLPGEAVSPGTPAVPRYIELDRVLGTDARFVPGYPIPAADAPFGSYGHDEYEDAVGHLLLRDDDGHVVALDARWEWWGDPEADAPGRFIVLEENLACSDGSLREGSFDAALVLDSGAGETWFSFGSVIVY